MRTLVLTGHDANYEALAEITTPSKANYALHHGFDFKVNREWEPGTHPSWQKLRLLMELQNEYDCIIWFDTDTVIMNPDAFKPDLVTEGNNRDTCLVASEDWCAPEHSPFSKRYISMGNFLWYKTKRSEEFLTHALRNVDSFGNRPNWEQDAILRLMHNYPQLNRMVGMLPRTILNATLCATKQEWRYKEGDLLIHLTGVSNRIELAKKYAELSR